MKQTWAAPERNKQPILDVLTRVLPRTPSASASILEIASGSGQHAAYFAVQLPGWTWQPSDVDSANLASTAAWVEEVALPNLRPPLRIDVLEADWQLGDGARFDAIYCANMIHIAPWSCCEGLIAGVARYLKPGGYFFLYGPFRIAGEHTSESNATFDASLKSRNPAWGVRDTDDVIALARSAGIAFIERVAMPANNQTLVLQR